MESRWLEVRVSFVDETLLDEAIRFSDMALTFSSLLKGRVSSTSFRTMDGSPLSDLTKGLVLWRELKGGDFLWACSDGEGHYKCFFVKA